MIHEPRSRTNRNFHNSFANLQLKKFHFRFLYWHLHANVEPHFIYPRPRFGRVLSAALLAQEIAEMHSTHRVRFSKIRLLPSGLHIDSLSSADGLEVAESRRDKQFSLNIQVSCTQSFVSCLKICKYRTIN